MHGTRTVAVLLAAGAGSRFRGPTHKLLAPLGDGTVVGAAVRHAVQAGIGPVVVVAGAVELGEVVADEIARHPDPPDVATIDHAGWADGQATSLRVAIDHAARLGADAVVVGLGDQPWVDPDAWRAVAGSDAPIAVATYDGRRRNPVRLHRSVWHLLPTDGDEGARTVLRMRPDLVEEVPCPGSPADIDTEEDLPPWPNRS